MKEFKSKFDLKSAKDREEILSRVATLSTEDIAAMLCQLPEEDLWTIIRDSLLALRVRVPKEIGDNPLSRGIEYLYALTRFVEISRRFPRKEEQGEILEELRSKRPVREDKHIAEVVTLMRKASLNPSSREAARQLQERSRFYRKADNVQLDTIPIFDENGFLYEHLRKSLRSKSNKREGPKRGGDK